MDGEKHDENTKDFLKRKPWLKDYLWKPGQSGNPAGRPKGKTLKEWAREFLEELPDERKLEFLREIEPDIVWKMAEGNAQTDITSGGEKINPIPILSSIDVPSDNSPQKDKELNKAA